MTFWNIEDIQRLFTQYADNGGEVREIREGVLGYGTTICFGHNLKTTVIQEIPLNEWSSGHTVRMYNKCPKKYQQYINE